MDQVGIDRDMAHAGLHVSKLATLFLGHRVASICDLSAKPEHQCRCWTFGHPCLSSYVCVDGSRMRDLDNVHDDRIRRFDLYRLTSTEVQVRNWKMSWQQCSNHFESYSTPSFGYVSPAAMVTCPSVLTRLESLRIGYRSCPHQKRQLPPPPPTRTLLPVLIEFGFIGTSEYLEDLVAQIDIPST
jgi:hypothetical protein